MMWRWKREVIRRLDDHERRIDWLATELFNLQGKVRTMTATEQDLKNDMDSIKALVQKQADAIAALSAAAPGVMTQEQLDELDAEAKAILGTTPTPAAPPAPPTT